MFSFATAGRSLPGRCPSPSIHTYIIDTCPATRRLDTVNDILSKEQRPTHSVSQRAHTTGRQQHRVSSSAHAARTQTLSSGAKVHMPLESRDQASRASRRRDHLSSSPTYKYLLSRWQAASGRGASASSAMDPSLHPLADSPHTLDLSRRRLRHHDEKVPVPAGALRDNGEHDPSWGCDPHGVASLHAA